MTELSWRWRVAQWLELRWWKRYLRNRSPRDYLQWKRAYWNDFLSKLDLPTLENKVILDAGCGPAGIFLALKGNRVTATDPLVEKYSSSLPHFLPQEYPYVNFRTQSLEQLADKDLYDITFCLNAINHVSDIRLSFTNLIKATKPGGYIVVSIDSHRHRWLIPFFRLLPGDALHPHQYDTAGYLDFLKNDCDIIQNILLVKGNIFDYRVITARKR